MPGVEGAEREDYDEREAGVGGFSGFWRPASVRFDTWPRVCRIKL